jgi:hypothetical protein
MTKYVLVMNETTAVEIYETPDYLETAYPLFKGISQVYRLRISEATYSLELLKIQ